MTILKMKFTSFKVKQVLKLNYHKEIKFSQEAFNKKKKGVSHREAEVHKSQWQYRLSLSLRSNFRTAICLSRFKDLSFGGSKKEFILFHLLFQRYMKQKRAKKSEQILQPYFLCKMSFFFN